MRSAPSPTVLDPRRHAQSRVVAALRRRLRQGELVAGQSLPTVRRLAQELSVDKGTVVRALAVMQEEGLIRRQGRRLHVGGEAPPVGEPVGGLLSDTILVLTSVEVSAGSSPDSWVEQLVHGVLSSAHAEHRHTLVLHPRTLPPQQLSKLLDAQPLGVVQVMAFDDHEQREQMLRRLHDSRVPVVFYGEQTGVEGVDVITPDHLEGTRLLTRALIDRGCRRILRYWAHRTRTHERPTWLRDRDQGYEMAMREAGLEIIDQVEYRRPDYPGFEPRQAFDAITRHAAGYLIEHLTGPRPVDAILTAVDEQVPEVAAACRLFGRVPGRDVLLGGYDGNWAGCPARQWEPTPPTFSVRYGMAQMGRQLVEALLQRIADPSSVARRRTGAPQIITMGAAE